MDSMAGSTATESTNEVDEDFFADLTRLLSQSTLNETPKLTVPTCCARDKSEVPKDKEELVALQARLRKRYPVDAYNKARRELDPNGILSNHMLERLFPESDTI